MINGNVSVGTTGKLDLIGGSLDLSGASVANSGYLTFGNTSVTGTYTMTNESASTVEYASSNAAAILNVNYGRLILNSTAQLTFADGNYTIGTLEITSGGTKQFGTGTYLIGNTVTIGSGLSDLVLQGSASGTIFQLSGAVNGAMFDIGSSAVGALRTVVAISDMTLDGLGTTGSTLSIQNADVVIARATIRNGSASMGGNIYLDGTSVISLTNTVVENGTATTGGNVYLATGAVLTMTGTAVQGGTAVTGGNIYVNAGAQVTMENSSVTGGTAVAATSADGGIGGGIYLAAANSVEEGAQLVALNSTIANNRASFGGSGIHAANYAAMYLANVTVTANVNTGNAPTGAGIYAASGTTLTAVDSIIAYNHAQTVTSSAQITTVSEGSGTKETTVTTTTYADRFSDIYADTVTLVTCVYGNLTANTQTITGEYQLHFNYNDNSLNRAEIRIDTEVVHKNAKGEKTSVDPTVTEIYLQKQIVTDLETNPVVFETDQASGNFTKMTIAGTTYTYKNGSWYNGSTKFAQLVTNDDGSVTYTSGTDTLTIAKDGSYTQVYNSETTTGSINQGTSAPDPATH